MAIPLWSIKWERHGSLWWQVVGLEGSMGPPGANRLLAMPTEICIQDAISAGRLFLVRDWQVDTPN
jgi:hypothetical protein